MTPFGRKSIKRSLRCFNDISALPGLVRRLGELKCGYVGPRKKATPTPPKRESKRLIKSEIEVRMYLSRQLYTCYRRDSAV